MIDRLMLVLTFLAALGCGSMAGFFFAFSACVMGALARLPAAQGIAAMQSINVVVINRLFLGTFFGTAVFCLLVAIAALLMWGRPGTIPVLAGSVLYLIGTILVTVRFNVPLNDELAAADANSAEAASLWSPLPHRLDGVEPRPHRGSRRGGGIAHRRRLCAGSRRRHLVRFFASARRHEKCKAQISVTSLAVSCLAREHGRRQRFRRRTESASCRATVQNSSRL